MWHRITYLCRTCLIYPGGWYWTYGWLGLALTIIWAVLILSDKPPLPTTTTTNNTPIPTPPPPHHHHHRHHHPHTHTYFTLIHIMDCQITKQLCLARRIALAPNMQIKFSVGNAHWVIKHSLSKLLPTCLNMLVIKLNWQDSQSQIRDWIARSAPE